MIPFILGTFLAMYSEMPTSDSIRRIIAPLSSCKGGAVPSREWLGGRIVSFGASVAESEGTIGKVADKSSADFDSSVASSTFNFFDGGSSMEFSNDFEMVGGKFAPGRSAGIPLVYHALISEWPLRWHLISTPTPTAQKAI